MILKITSAYILLVHFEKEVKVLQYLNNLQNKKTQMRDYDLGIIFN
jgi:hypothetical protein